MGWSRCLPLTLGPSPVIVVDKELQGMKERRKGRRFSVTLSVFVRAKNGVEPHIETSATDMGSRGIFVGSAKGWGLGTHLELEIILPIAPDKECPRVLCTGTVVRFQESKAGRKAGVGIAISNYQFIRNGRVKTSGSSRLYLA